MVTKNDFCSIKELHDQYNPASRGIITAEEMITIKNILELENRTNIELENIRNVVVMLYTQWVENARKEGNSSKAMLELDAMDAICTIVDLLKAERGMEP